MPYSAKALRLAALLVLGAPALLCAQDASTTVPASVGLPIPQLVREKAQGEALTLEACISRAMAKNFDLKIETYNVQNAGESLKIAQADFTPQFSLSTTRAGSQNYTSQTEVDSLSTRAAVSQKIASGATVSLSTSLDRGSTNPASGLYNPAYDADVALSATQPLLKNFGTTANKATERRAEIGVKRAGLAYKGAVLDMVYSVEVAYYNLCFAREQLEVRRHGLLLAEQLLNENIVRKEVGSAIQLDVAQAEVGVANARRAIIQAQQAVQDRQDALLALIGQFELDSQIGTVTFPEAKDLSPSYDVSFKKARENQPDYMSSAEYIRQLQIDADATKRNRLPSLDLESAVGYNTHERSVGRAYNELPGSDGYNWQVGLALRIPWGLKAENARYRSSINSLNQGRARHQQLEQAIMVDVRSAVRSVHTNKESVEISAKASRLSEENYAREMERWRAGTVTPRRVLEAKDDLENALYSELQAKVNLHIAIAALHRLEASSLERYTITLQ